MGNRPEPAMPIVKFLGHIIPDRGLTITSLPQLSFVYPSGLQAQLKIKIEKSLLTVECDLNQYTASEFEMLHLHVLHISRAAVDVVSFSNGWGLTTVIEDFIDPDGVSKRVQAVDPTLENICTIPHAEVFSLVTDFAVSLILHTLTSTLTQPYLWTVNCARAVESIARLISPDEDESA
jgi:hypothetical protein